MLWGFSFPCLEKVPRLLGSIGMVEGIGEGEFSIWGARNIHSSLPVSRTVASRPGLCRVHTFFDH